MINLIIDEMSAIKSGSVTQKLAQALRDQKEKYDKTIATLREKDKGTNAYVDLIAELESNRKKIMDAICDIAENKRNIDEEEYKAMLRSEDLERSLRLIEQISTTKNEALGTATTAGVAVVSTGVATATGVTAFTSAASAGVVGVGAGVVASTILLPAAIVIGSFTLLSGFAIHRLTRKK